MQEDASFRCDSCGEEIVVPIDVTEGRSQQYIEDCPVCCHPNTISVSIDDDGRVAVRAQCE